MQHFLCKTQILSAPGSLSALAQMHIKRLLIVADPFFVENGTVNHIAHLSHVEAVEVFSKVVPDPSVELVTEGTQLVLDFRPDAILALGGGSAMDCAKAMRYFSSLPAQLIAVPTTSGSGSEVTNFAILTHDGSKHPLVDESLRPDVAILDSDLLRSLPKKLIADTGFDLISHALEAWVAKDASPFSDALALQALEIAFSQLPRSFAGDQAARQSVHTASTMAGICFSCTGLGVCHALSHGLGGRFHTPHGRLNAILLPAVLDYNSGSALHRYADLSRRLGLSSGADLMAFRALKQTLIRLRRSLSLPETLLDAGISPAALAENQESIFSAALADPCCATNPLLPTKDHLLSILQQVTGHA